MLLQKIQSIALLTALSAGLLTSCTVAEMYQSDTLLQTNREVPLEGRKFIRLKQDFKIGSFAVDGVHRGWTRVWEQGLGPLAFKSARQRFEFTLVDSTGASTYVSCQAGINSSEVQLGKVVSVSLGGDDREVFVSTLHVPNSSAWQLITKDPGHPLSFQSFLGVLQNGDKEIMVEPVYRYKSKHRVEAGEILGYEFKSGQEVLGAVQVINKGKVWVNKDLDFQEQRLISAAAAALLLYQKLENTMPAEPNGTKIKLPLSLLK
ncbi:hypothetical protein TH63_19000 [Rufibacter radiotolerans]|uniref:Lipoprotein n=1 Tax=Rufibacter radiotolerans TaxID=1379910 RepID=A0A0H4VTW9_9BACT|nr:hypothetical protein [Rufibacter radiotolerans]AKQ47254.1 hypothetical protein TH63_19000 [Rufibacter radiotolerans]